MGCRNAHLQKSLEPEASPHPPPHQEPPHDASCSISVSSILGSCAAAWGSMRAKGDGVRLGVTPALAVACIAHALVSHYVMSDRH